MLTTISQLIQKLHTIEGTLLRLPLEAVDPSLIAQHPKSNHRAFRGWSKPVFETEGPVELSCASANSTVSEDNATFSQ